MGCVCSSEKSHWGVAKFSSVLFPAPHAAYGHDTWHEQLIWVPLAKFGGRHGAPCKSQTNPELDRYTFPCRILPGVAQPQYLIIFFHKNADDIGTCKTFCETLKDFLGVHVFVVEYPGYGLCANSSPSASQLMKHAFAALAFVEEAMRWPLERVIVLGASIGSGPALAVAAENQLGGVALIAPLYNLKTVVRAHAGPLANLFCEQFPNDELAPKVESPTFMLHGDCDKVVPLEQGNRLYELFTCHKHLETPQGVGHNSNLVDDPDIFLKPLKEFFGLPGNAGQQPLTVPPWAFERHQPWERSVSGASSTNSSTELLSPRFGIGAGSEPLQRTRTSCSDCSPVAKRTLTT